MIMSSRNRATSAGFASTAAKFGRAPTASPSASARAPAGESSSRQHSRAEPAAWPAAPPKHKSVRRAPIARTFGALTPTAGLFGIGCGAEASERLRLIDEHDGDVVANFVAQTAPRAAQFVLFGAVLQLAP